MASPPTMIVPIAALASGLLALSAPGNANADPVDPKELEVRLKDRARSAMEADELREARSALIALERLNPSVDTTCNLGLVARRLGLFVEAVESLSKCVSAYEAAPASLEDAGERARVNELHGELSMAKAEVATVTIRAPRGATVMIDQQPVMVGDGALDRPHFVAPGWHTIEVGSDRRRVELKAGTKAGLRFEAPPLEPRRVDPVVVAGWVSSGGLILTGGALLVVAEATSVSAGDDEAIAAAAAGGCRNAAVAPEECRSFQSAQDVAHGLRVAAVASFVGAGALAIGTLVYTSRRPSAPRVAVGASSVKVVFVW